MTNQSAVQVASIVEDQSSSVLKFEPQGDDSVKQSLDKPISTPVPDYSNDVDNPPEEHVTQVNQSQPSSQQLQDYEAQLRLLDKQNKERLMSACQEDPSLIPVMEERERRNKDPRFIAERVRMRAQLMQQMAREEQNAAHQTAEPAEHNTSSKPGRRGRFRR